MIWEKPKYSKELINWAGRVISGKIKSTDEEGQKAITILENWRASHSYPLHVFQMRLKKRAEKINSNSIVAQRLKRTPAIMNKLKRIYPSKSNPSMKLYQMQDIGGCRAILPTIEEAIKLYENDYLKGDLKHKKTGEKNYVKKPKPDGYRGYHLVYDYISDKNKKEYNGLKTEIQIRSKLQHIWATSLETIDFITQQAMKFGKGREEWTDFFFLVSSAFAEMEGCDYLPNTPNEKKALYLKIKEREKELNAIGKMEAFTTAIKTYGEIDNKDKKRKPKFFLLDLDLEENRLIIKNFTEKEKEIAIKEYSEKELKNRNNDKYDIVLVSVDDAKDLQKAYPNYFADTKEFIEILREIVNKY